MCPFCIPPVLLYCALVVLICRFSFYIYRYHTSLFMCVTYFVHHVYLFRVTEEATNEGEKNLGAEKPVGEDGVADGNKETPVNEPEEKEPEEKVNGSII